MKIATPTEPIFHWNIQQGTTEWTNIRTGKITSSVAKEFFRKPKDKTMPFGAAAMNEAMRIAIERVSGQPAPSRQFFSKQTDRGNTLEPKARDHYELATMTKVTEVGFIDCGKYGTSPDAVVMPNGLCEIKSYSDATKIMKAALGTNLEHDPQIRWHMYCVKEVNFEWCDFCAFYPELPKASAIKRYYQDTLQNKLFDAKLSLFEETIEKFIYEYENSKLIF